MNQGILGYLAGVESPLTTGNIIQPFYRYYLKLYIHSSYVYLMYSYYARLSSSSSSIKSLICQLVKNSPNGYLVCLKSNSIEVYSLRGHSKDKNDSRGDASTLPVLTTTVNANSTFLSILEYRPPNEKQSHLLVLTHNFTLLLLTYDSSQSKFTSRNVASLQEPFSKPTHSNIIFKVDSGYNLVLFHGHSRVIKCIVLDKENYFNFSDIVTMRTSDARFLDIQLMSAEYTSSSEGSCPQPRSTSYTSSLNQDLQFKSPTRNSTFHYLECKLLVLGQDNDGADEVEPIRWLYGMQLLFEIELLNGYKRFNSYSNLPLFGEPVRLPSPCNKFVPLSLNARSGKFDSVLLMGPGAVAYSSFKNPKDLKYFRLDRSITEVTCYLHYAGNKYIFADDNGCLYLMELSLSSAATGTGLKRRVSSGSASTPTYVSKTVGDLVVNGVSLARLGKCSVPSSIVKLDEHRIFYTSKFGDSSTMAISINAGTIERLPDQERWTHTNLGPISDFVYGEESQDGTRSILACCGVGYSGALCKIDFGLASDPLFTQEVAGVSDLFSVPIESRDPGKTCSLLCVSFYSYTTAYRITFYTLQGCETSHNKASIDNVLSKVGKITRLENTPFCSQEKTLLLTTLMNDLILHVSPTTISLLTQDLCLKERVTLSSLIGPTSGSETVVSSLLCGYQIILMLSNDSLVLMDSDLKALRVKKVNMSLSSVAYAPRTDIANSDFASHPAFQSPDFQGLIALSTWDNKILLLSLTELDFLTTHACSLNFGAFLNSLKFARVEGDLYLLASVSDGKLHIYKLTTDHKTSTATHLNLENHLDLGQKSFRMLDVPAHGHQQTCDLSKTNLITTGEKCSIIYVNNNKITHTKMNINNLTTITAISTRQLGSHPTKSGGPAKTVKATGAESVADETLVMYYDGNRVFISKLDFVKNLRVQKMLPQTNLNKIAYHSTSKLAVVSTIPQCIVNPDSIRQNNANTARVGAHGLPEAGFASAVKVSAGGPTMGVSASACQLQPVSELPVYGTQQSFGSNALMCVDDGLSEGAADLVLESNLLLFDVQNKEAVYKLDMPRGHLVSSISNYAHGGVEYAAVGTSLVSPQKEVPVEGFLFLIQIDRESDAYRVRVQRTKQPFKGGVVEIATMNEMLVLAVNSTVLLMRLHSREPSDAPFPPAAPTQTEQLGDQGRNAPKSGTTVDDQKRYDLFQLEYQDRDPGNYLDLVTSYESNTYVVSLDTWGDTIFVGDLMTSVKMLKFKDTYLYEACRDFNTLWTTAVAAIDDRTCLVSDDSGNFTLFSKAENPVNDQQSIRFETLGLFHHGETVNKILKCRRTSTHYSSVKIASKLGKNDHHCSREFCCPTADANPAIFPLKRYSNLFETSFTCATSSGSLVQVSFFRDLTLFLKLSILEQTLQLIQREIGNVPNRNYRNFQNLHSTLHHTGFIDGDLVESFLKLPHTLKSKVYESYRQNALKIDIEPASLEQLVSDIENIKHNTFNQLSVNFN